MAIINQALADDLGILAGDVENATAKITVRIPKQAQLAADSALGKKTDLIESLVDLRVIKILPNQGLARFGLFPSQDDPLNVFVPIELLQDSLARTVLKHKAIARTSQRFAAFGHREYAAQRRCLTRITKVNSPFTRGHRPATQIGLAVL